jgi:hypothetical protein
MNPKVQEALANLRSLRDEVRLQIHRGGMDARLKLDALEVDFGKVQSAAKQATDGSIVALRDAYLDLKASLCAPSGKK